MKVVVHKVLAVWSRTESTHFALKYIYSHDKESLSSLLCPVRRTNHVIPHTKWQVLWTFNDIFVATLNSRFYKQSIFKIILDGLTSCDATVMYYVFETVVEEHISLVKFVSLAMRCLYAQRPYSCDYICHICHIYIYIYTYMYMWQMSSVFSHESAQRNDAGNLIDKNVFKTTRSFCYQWFHVSTLQANANRLLAAAILKMHFQDGRRQ